MSMQRPSDTGETGPRPIAAPTAEDRAVPLPNLCGDFSMRIDRNGTWYYRGSPIGRHALVRLFSTVLRRDANGLYWLTTPVENGQIDVEDAPFIGVELIVEGAGRNQIIHIRTNVDDIVRIDKEHPLRVATAPDTGEPRPYVFVRKGLEARLARSVFYHLVDLGEAEVAGLGDGSEGAFGVWSAGQFFPLGKMPS